EALRCARRTELSPTDRTAGPRCPEHRCEHPWHRPSHCCLVLHCARSFPLVAGNVVRSRLLPRRCGERTRSSAGRACPRRRLGGLATHRSRWGRTPTPRDQGGQLNCPNQPSATVRGLPDGPRTDFGSARHSARYRRCSELTDSQPGDLANCQRGFTWSWLSARSATVHHCSDTL